MAGYIFVQGALRAVGGGLCAAPWEAKRLPYVFYRYIGA